MKEGSHNPIEKKERWRTIKRQKRERKKAYALKQKKNEEICSSR
jgi:hypothetical protein